MKLFFKSCQKKEILIFALLSCISLIGYTLYTNHIWEDFFITFKFSENLCHGNGLVHFPGIKVHGFTSPLGVLLPALTYFLTGKSSYLGAIWLFRILFCIPAFIIGGIMLMRIIYNGKSIDKYVISLGIFYLLEVKSVMFSMNGMETALMLCFLSCSLYILEKGIIKNWQAAGLAWSGLMWTRPDSCVYVAALILSSFIFEEGSFKEKLIAIIKASLVTTVIYGIWFVWCWNYYGTPVPNTILAKSNLTDTQSFFAAVFTTLKQFPQRLAWIYGPVYPQFGKWPFIASLIPFIIAFISSFYWLLPKADRCVKKISFVFFILMIYMAYMPFPYPWYFPPVAMTGLLVFTYFIKDIECFTGKKDDKSIVPAGLLFMTGLFFVCMYMASSRQMALHQEIIETNSRKKIGEWLNQNSQPDDRIYLECLGYIGYFAERRMIDYPGLSSPEVVEICKNKDTRTFADVAEIIEPEWLVLRPFEVNTFINKKEFLQKYEVVKIFDQEPTVNQQKYLYGRNYLIYDSKFIILKQRKE